ncbi:tetratricopeptide repeat protein [Sorangium cellulosum]|uniref:tetratricopeptide repeat protein n=1 Tax=Sorangium cellulosum TaxID=56 RepID=UPI001F3D857B|nr:tetratricopeptide repeat protein [Sorangium cellulosum]
MSSSADAQQRSSSLGRSDSPTLKDLIRRARKARDRGNWTEARDAYKAALEAADQTPGGRLDRAEIAGELGLCELALLNYREAAELLTQSLEQREVLPIKVQQRFEMGQAKAAFYVVRLLLSVDPPDAEVFIDGKAIGRTARTYRLFLDPGRHVVRARAPGREEAVHVFNGERGAEQEISMQLPHAAVSSIKETSPATPRPVSRSPAARPEAPSPRASWPGTLRIGGIAITTATATAGAVFLLRAHVVHTNLREANEVRREQGWTSHACRDASAPAACAGIHGQAKERDLFATLGKVSLATSAAFGLATAASFLTEVAVFGTAPRAAGVRVVPVTTSEQAGVLLQAAW